LSDAPATGIALKGPVLWPQNLWGQILEQLRLAICTDDPSYASMREALRGEKAVPARVVTAILSAGVATKLGFEAAVCVPFVAIGLAAVVKMGVAAWCGANARSSPGPTSAREVASSVKASQLHAPDEGAREEDAGGGAQDVVGTTDRDGERD
jgi:hypothetical protein